MRNMVDIGQLSSKLELLEELVEDMDKAMDDIRSIVKSEGDEDGSHALLTAVRKAQDNVAFWIHRIHRVVVSERERGLLRAALDKGSPWHAVADGALPPDKRVVIVSMEGNNGMVDIANFDDTTRQFTSCVSDEVIPVAYWMFLPEAPKGRITP